MIWHLEVAKPAQKDLRKLPPKDLDRVKAALAAMEEDPFGDDIVRLKAQPAAWRRRAGSYRIFFDVYPGQLMVVVLAIKRRTSTTY